MTYPWATYAVIEEKPYCGMRLSPIKAPVKRLLFAKPEFSNALVTGDEEDRLIKERRAAQKYPLLASDIAIGYRGNLLFFSHFFFYSKM